MATTWGHLESKGNIVELSTPEIWVGRDSQCTLQFQENHISSLHCKISNLSIDGSQMVYLEDTSTNGTFLNGQRMQKGRRVILQDLDEVSFPTSDSEKITYIFHEQSKREEIAPPRPSMKRGLTVELKSTHISEPSPKKLKTKPLRFFEVDEKQLRESSIFISAQSLKNGCTIIKLKRPHVADTSYAAEEFKKAELAFRRFVNRDRMFQVTEVDVIINPFLETNFRKMEEEISEKMRKNHQISKNISENWKDKPQQFKWMSKLEECIFWYNENETSSNPILAWHGTKEENISSISQDGFKILSEKDSGWYGKGIYFTQLPNYGEFYIHQGVSTFGENFRLILSWVLLGEPFPLTEKIGGKSATKGYDSNFVLVNGFEPCGDKEPTGDEIVVFKEALPRYTVKYEIVKKAKFNALALFDSSDEENETKISDIPEESINLGQIAKETSPISKSEEIENILVLQASVKIFTIEDNKEGWQEKSQAALRITEKKLVKVNLAKGGKIGMTSVVAKDENTGVTILSVGISPELECSSQGKRDAQLVIVEKGVPKNFLLRFKNSIESLEFVDRIDAIKNQLKIVKEYKVL